MEISIKDVGFKPLIVDELTNLGCCDLCIMRYLGNADPYLYRQDKMSIKKFLHNQDKKDFVLEEVQNISSSCDVIEGTGVTKDDGSGEGPAAKISRITPCVTCLGLLDPDHGTSQKLLDQVVDAVKEANIQAKFYTVNLTLPVSVLFRAHFVWYLLEDSVKFFGSWKFPSVYKAFPNLKPAGICLKNIWKWICTGRLKSKIDPKSEWSTDGNMTINVALKYANDDADCIHLSREVDRLSAKRGKHAPLSRVQVESLFLDMGIFEFHRKFGNLPPVATDFLVLDKISCSHVPIFIAGRYCKYTRNVSQTPWIVDGKDIHEGNVEAILSDHILKLMDATDEKFSASGREDVDVRMLGRGRPFMMEVINPKKTLFSQADINEVRNRINGSTKLISVQDLQIVEKKYAGNLKDGEELKRKTYCALCIIPEGVTAEMLEKLNNIPVPLVLKQKTPIRVLHRRSLATRERSVYSIKAIAAESKNLFKLHVQTQAGTYVKEFVHGDLRRTKPSIAEILNCDADIVALDVESVDFDWPPEIPD